MIPRIKISNEIVFILFLFASLIVGFYLNEDTLGSAKADFASNLLRTIYLKDNLFSDNFSVNYLNTRHSPFFFFYSSLILRIVEVDELFRILHLFLPILIFLYLYKSLCLRFNNINNKKLFMLSSIIFISPTVRSYSIWIDSYLLGLLFFVLSVYTFLKFLKFRNEINIYLNIFFLAVAQK